jgi:aminoglycoside 6'-N-acetyltransferase I
MQIVDLLPENKEVILQVARIVVEGFRAIPAWPDLDAALEEVRESFDPGCISRVALDEHGTVMGWIGGRPQYDGHVWELHPLVVRPAHQREGIGSALVADLEEQARSRGGITLWLGTDDEDAQTSLSGVDLYPDPLSHLARIENLRDHPYEFYQKVGFVLVGVLPDANGPGKPDIFMAKSLLARR